MGVISEIKSDLDKGALRLLSEYHGLLLNHAKSLVSSSEEAEDLVFCTIERVLAKSDTYDSSKGDLLTWMKAIMTNLHRDGHRRKLADAVFYCPNEELAETADESAADAVLANSDGEYVRQVVASLPPELREVIVLQYFAEQPVAKVAKILAIPPGTVASRVHLAKKILMKKLGPEFGRMKKPLAVLGALLLGVTALFAAYQAGKVEEVEEVEKVEEVVEEVEEGSDCASNRRSPTGILSASEKEREPSVSTSRGGVVSQNEDDFSSKSQESTKQAINETPEQEKPTMNLKHTIAAAALAVTATVVTVEADGVTMKVDQIKQRYPWNGLVDIDYTVTFGQNETLGVDDNLEVLMVDKAVSPAVTNRANTFLQAPLPLTAGSHRITWNANADGVTNRTDAAEYHLKVVHYTESYMVIDVSGGSTANVYPVDFLNGAPLDGFNAPEYKGDKIVLRRIHPGTYMAGSPEDEYDRKENGSEEQHPVAITKPFYIGVFEVTQRQYENVMGSNSNPSKTKLPYHPVEQTIYNTHVRGSGTIPSGATFIAKLMGKCRSWNAEKQDYADAVTGFDLPTDFQWEYACRAGTTKAFNLTDDFDNASSEAQKGQLLQLGRFTDNKGTETHAEVGTYLPNAWGLYDMHGNVVELCRDWWHDKALEIKPYVDPEWVTTGTYRATRGGELCPRC